MRWSLAVIAGAPLLMATSCIHTYPMRTAPGPVRGRPAIVSERYGGERVFVNGLTVRRCRPEQLPHVAWAVERGPAADSAEAADSVVYGRAPAGFLETHPPEPLAPRCYEMDGHARPWRSFAGRDSTGWGVFHIAGDSATDGEWDVRADKQMRRALLACRGAFRRARTAADTAQADTRVFPVADTTVSCAFARTHLAGAMRREPSRGRAALNGIAAFSALFAASYAVGALDRARHR
jgi:hypothetical protein